ncbi:hypothetical protein ACJX0J_034043 [Zea mays]
MDIAVVGEQLHYKYKFEDEFGEPTDGWLDYIEPKAEALQRAFIWFDCDEKEKAFKILETIAQVKIDDLKDGVNHVRGLNENYRILSNEEDSKQKIQVFDF